MEEPKGQGLAVASKCLDILACSLQSQFHLVRPRDPSAGS